VNAASPQNKNGCGFAAQNESGCGFAAQNKNENEVEVEVPPGWTSSKLKLQTVNCKL
jgi:hypothetical protein